MSPVPSADLRAARAAQGAVAVLVLAGFVFRVDLLLFAATLLALVDAATGPASGPTARLYRWLVAHRPRRDRTASATATSSPPTGVLALTAGGLRSHAALVAGVLTLATLLALADLGGLAWLVAMVGAVVAALAAGARWFLGMELVRRGRD